MNPEAQALIKRSDALLADAKFDDVIALAEPYLDDPDADMQIAARLKMATTLFYRGECVASDYMIKSAYAMRESVSPDLQVEAMLAYSNFLAANYSFFSEVAILYAQAQRLAEQVNYQTGAVTARIMLTMVMPLSSMKRQEEMEENLALAQSLREPTIKYLALHQLASHYGLMTKQWKKASEYFQQALSVVREHRNQPEECTAISNLARTLLYAREAEKSIALSNQALELAQAMHYPIGEMWALDALGIAYWRSSPTRALTYFEPVLTLATSANHPYFIRRALDGIGAMAMKQRDKARMRQTIEVMLARRRVDLEQGRLHISMVDMINRLAQLYRSQKQFDKAALYWRAALALERQLGYKATVFRRLKEFIISLYEIAAFLDRVTGRKK